MSDSDNTSTKPVTISRRTLLRDGLFLVSGILTSKATDAFGATQYGIGNLIELEEGIKGFFGINKRSSTNAPYDTPPQGEASMKVLSYKDGPRAADVFVGVDGPIDQITITDTSRRDPRDERKPFVYTVHVDTSRNEAVTRMPVKGSSPGVFGSLETVHTKIAGTRGRPHLHSATVIDQQGYTQHLPAKAPVVKQAEKDLIIALNLGVKAKGASNVMQQNIADAPTTRVETLPDGGVKLVRTFTHRNLPGGKVTHEIPMSPGTHDTMGLTLELVSNLTQAPDYRKIAPSRLEGFSRAAINTMLWEAQKLISPPPRSDALLGNTVNLNRVKIQAPDLKGRPANALDHEVPSALDSALNGLKGGASYDAKAEETWSAPGQSDTTRPKSNAKESSKWRDMRGPLR
ncbi:MAG: hypothetical protein EOM37_06430 [Proteobacteria bacterium]|jgi:hypothetical protein|nr:hypothetical protein [Alphaproteobacteria bacterium]NCC03665.1 hypothetical protein [Pseudomonadota bacterium]